MATNSGEDERLLRADDVGGAKAEATDDVASSSAIENFIMSRKEDLEWEKDESFHARDC